MNAALRQSLQSVHDAGSWHERARAALATWRTRLRERAELARMTAAELRDAGITPYDANREARKPFWRA